MYIRSTSSPSTVLWAFHTIQPSSLKSDYYDMTKLPNATQYITAMRNI